jgi:uncharacterized protein (UPF0335 family)
MYFSRLTAGLEERLRTSCDTNDIEIKDVFREDHSAKTFDRPVWTKLLAVLKKRKNKAERNTVLFIQMGPVQPERGSGLPDDRYAATDERRGHSNRPAC